MPARTRRRKKRLPGIIVLIPAAALIYYLLTLPLWNIHEVRINGANLLLADELKSYCAIPVGENLFFASLAEARNRLKTVSALKSFRLYRLPPGTVQINIKERLPVAVIVGKNRSAIIDNEGYILNQQLTLNVPNLTQLPVISGVGSEEFTGKETIKPEIAHLINIISAHLGSKQIKLEVGGLEKISFLLDDILKVKLGRDEDLDRKMAVFKKLQPVVAGNWASVEYIDVRYPDNPVIKFK